MILSRLKVENFKKYVSKEFSFDEGLIGIIGKNGSGKSTIFEAILFALYGEFKNRGYKDIVRNANASVKDSVSVELDFEFENISYTIVREFRGKSLSTFAKLIKNGEMICSGAKEVTQSIVKLTKMNKEAFVHTLFASQKELTSLSTLKNEDRKKMIRKLLGLEKIDYIENMLVEKSRELKREINAFAEVLLGAEEIEAKQRDRAEYKEKQKILESDVALKSKELDAIRLQELDIKKELESLQKTKEKRQNIFSSLELLKSTINSHISNETKLLEEIEHLELKEKELKGLESVKSEYSRLHESIKEQEKLKEYHIRKEHLLSEQINLREHYSKSKESITSLENECKEHGKYIEKEKVLELGVKELKEQIEQKLEEEKGYLHIIAGEEKLIADTNKKIETIQKLGRESSCPTCTRPLLDEYDNVLESLNSLVISSQKDKIDKTKQKLRLATKVKKELEEQYNKTNHEYHELSKLINLIESKKRDLSIEKEHFKKVETQGLKNKEELQKLEAYNYDSKKHEELLDKQKELKVKYEYVLSLETMLKRLDSIKAEVKEISKNITQLNKKYEDSELEYKQIAYDETKHKDKQKSYDEVQKSKEEKVTLLNNIKVEIATITGQIKSIQTSLDNNEIQLKKLQLKKDDLSDYDKIKISLAEFKTKLNSKIAPRISDIASNMYSQITKGKYQHIEVSNDFDFFIYDEGKKYPIERFSGGEVDLANLVLRIAISKTLAELNGASSIEFLAFDEVFGSQDEARRMEILEAFHTINEQYRQIFLISHEMEIKEMFERVVEL